MFLDGYKRNWLHTEGLSFEDRMIDDLSVSTVGSHFIFSDERFTVCSCRVFATVLYRRRWRKRRRRKRRRRRSLILFISSSFTSAARLSQRKGERDELQQRRHCLLLTNTTLLYLLKWRFISELGLFTANSMWIICTWRMLTSWQRWESHCFPLWDVFISLGQWETCNSSLLYVSDLTAGRVNWTL